MTLPFILAAVFIGPFLRWAQGFRRHLGMMEKVMGGLLVCFGLLIGTNSMNVIANWMLHLGRAGYRHPAIKERPMRLLAFALILIAVPAQAAEIGEDGLHKQPWFAVTFKDMPRISTDAGDEGKRLAVIFEQRGCIYCKKLHEEVFSDPEISAYIQENFTVVQMNLFGDEEVTDFDGEAMAGEGHGPALGRGLSLRRSCSCPRPRPPRAPRGQRRSPPCPAPSRRAPRSICSNGLPRRAMRATSISRSITPASWPSGTDTGPDAGFGYGLRAQASGGHM